MTREAIHTDQAPDAIGTYSQAVRAGDTVYLSGQIPLVPETMQLHDGPFADQVRQVFNNLAAVCRAAGGELADIAKLTIYLTDLEHFAEVNAVMAEFFDAPYPARAAVGVRQLPKGAVVEMDAVLIRP